MAFDVDPDLLVWVQMCRVTGLVERLLAEFVLNQRPYHRQGPQAKDKPKTQRTVVSYSPGQASLNLAH